MAVPSLSRLLWAVLVCLSAIAHARVTTTTTKHGSSTISSSKTSSGTRPASSSTLSTRSTTSSSSSRPASTTLTTVSTRRTSSISATTGTTTRSSSSRTTSTTSRTTSSHLTSSTTRTTTTTTTTYTTSTSKATVASTTSNACPSASPSGNACPSAWTAIIADLAPAFRDSNGECTDMARGAIRYAFHDAAGYSNKTTPYSPASGGADGSLLLSSSEISRSDNAGLAAFHANITAKYNHYKSDCATRVGAADLIQVAGWLGVQACPGGQIGRVYVGRNDSDQAAPDGLLPMAFGPGSDHDTIFQLFQEKGFTARDLAALMGAHSSSKAFFQTQHGIPAGTPQDSTPGTWDSNYYTEIYNPPAGIGRFESDINLSNTSTSVGREFPTMQNLRAWQSSYSSAHQKLSLLGLDPNARFTMQDCTSLISRAVFS